jgi:phosphoglucosamine mutase
VKLFGSSGIRGIANTEITPTLAQRLGSVLATIHEGGEFVVGRDPRVTGPMLEDALSAGIMACGGDAKLVDLLPTPVIAWLTRELESDAGIAISASHNPPQYNGLKVFNARGMSLTEKEQGPVESLMQSGELDYAPWDGIGSADPLEAAWMYLDAIQDVVEIGKDWKIACDLFCGATGVIAADTFEAVGLRATLINSNPDGHFPAGDPEPTTENLRRLGVYMKATGAEIGFGFDGDGDRMMTVDETGTPVSGDRLLAAYAGHVVGREGKGIVVTHVGASMCVEDMVEAAGGKVVRVRVGDAYITEEIERRRAVFGGEPIGAWVIPEVHMCPDGLLSALKLLEALEEREMTLSQFASEAPEYPTKSAKVEVPNKALVMKGVESGYKRAFGEAEVNRVDGVRLQVPEGWILIRASGTEPLIRLTAEGRDEKATTSLIECGRELVREASR